MDEPPSTGAATAPAMPTGYVFVTVTGNYIEWTGLAENGVVRFTADPSARIDANTILLPREIVGKVTQGVLTVSVPASDDVNPEWTYTIKECFPGGRTFQALITKSMAPTVDITTLTLIAPDVTSGFGPVQGPPGPTGPTGPAGGPTGATGPSGTPALNYARTTTDLTTGVLASSAQETGTVSLAPGWQVRYLTADRSCRIRLYTDAASRAADQSRAMGVDPTGNIGLLLDVYMASSGTIQAIAPGYTADASANVPYTIDNLSGASSAVDITFGWIRTE